MILGFDKNASTQDLAPVSPYAWNGLASGSEWYRLLRRVHLIRFPSQDDPEGMYCLVSEVALPSQKFTALLGRLEPDNIQSIMSVNDEWGDYRPEEFFITLVAVTNKTVSEIEEANIVISAGNPLCQESNCQRIPLTSPERDILARWVNTVEGLHYVRQDGPDTPESNARLGDTEYEVVACLDVDVMSPQKSTK